ncbi:hypothetical protein H4J37_03690 [Psychrobacter sp. Urea-trap-16]|nr:hypothetical protein [Psychrobacter sp. Urea-trap-18]MBA6285371.1 hypothetical protein [Psychrobacter sp. Urea-trap-16]MBA6319109.1 hypothetical protein [Psychrobacter sp. Urea-trap-20]MBA6335128.1 hypothetical protein [Psychrobacter sp. Urea-trap-19]PKG59726.1 hypothetical protein CXF63_11185 [Psychrobacter sp. Choline-3u-12]
MSRRLISIAALSLAACTPAQDERDKFVSGGVAVHEAFWAVDHDTPYPFTTDGEISCVYYPDFGIEVYFQPFGYIEDSSIGTPLNKAAAESLKKDGMIPNVPYSIKEGADLSEAVAVGLKVCREIKIL